MKLFYIAILISVNSFAQINDTLKANQIIDTTSIVDTNRITLKDSTRVLYFNQLDNSSSFIPKERISKTNYRFAGDLLNEFPLSFQRDYGFVGYPNEVMIFGTGSVNLMTDGVSLNDRFSNSFNLNLIQTEDIDSIEIVPLPRGFLYGSYMYPVTVNFITKDFIPPKPYSRIRYIQGPDREASVDANFHALVSKKFLFSFDISNRIKDSTFRNTEFGLWQIKTRLKYFLTDDINLITSYNYNDYKIGFNGGVNIDEIIASDGDVNSILYNDFLAPVYFPNGEMKILQHFPKLSVLTNFFTWLKSDLNLYYRFTKDEVRRDFNLSKEEKLFGMSLRNKISSGIVDLELNYDFENQKNFQKNSFIESPQYIPYDMTSDSERDIHSFTAIVSTKLFQEKLHISLFYKKSVYNEDQKFHILPDSLDWIYPTSYYSINPSNSGYGIDFSYKLSEQIKIYLGTSVLGKYSSDNDYFLFQGGINYKNDFISADINYFVNEYSKESSYSPGLFYSYRTGDVKGGSFSLKAKYAFLLLESLNAFYKSNSNSEMFYLPDFTTRTGIYFNDYLFNNNLDLKAGFLFTYTGKQKYILHHSLYPPRVIDVPSASKIDFTVSGEIQKSAVVYFIWENLPDKKYFLTPFYPMPFRNIRFGIAWEFLN